jgi:hypothetical protein
MFVLSVLISVCMITWSYNRLHLQWLGRQRMDYGRKSKFVLLKHARKRPDLGFQLSTLLIVFVWIIMFVVHACTSIKVPPKIAKQLCVNNSQKQIYALT